MDIIATGDFTTELTATTYESAQSADEVARVVEEIAHGSSEQASSTETGLETVQNLSKVIRGGS